MGRIIRIDLGTTTSEIAYVKDGKPCIIRNIEEGDGHAIPLSLIHIFKKIPDRHKYNKFCLLFRKPSYATFITKCTYCLLYTSKLF